MPSKPSTPQQKQIIILGCGITALSTSLSLRVSPLTSSYKQTIIASHIPDDFSIDYTSPNAGGHWRSFASLSDTDSEIRKWDKKTYEAWMAILENGYLSGEELLGVGLGVKESRKEVSLGGTMFGAGFVHGPYHVVSCGSLLSNTDSIDSYWAKETSETEGGDGRGLWWSKPRYRDMTVEGQKWFQGGVKGFEVLDLEKERGKGVEESIPEGAIFGVKYQSICINIPQYLSFMHRRVKEEGATVIKATVETSHGLEGGVKDAKRILMENDKSVKEEDIFAFINCAGLGARHFVSAEEAAKLFPIRGQTILVKGEATKARTYVGFGEEDELVYVIPRPGSGTTILGGCKQVGNWSPGVDEELNEKILERIKKWGLAEELRTARNGQFEVISYQVGLRPGRKGGPRVEVEKEGNGKVGGVWVVHSYGHAGGGYQCSSGCAEKVAEIVMGL